MARPDLETLLDGLQAPWSADVSTVARTDPPELVRLGFLRAYWELRFNRAVFARDDRSALRYRHALAALLDFANVMAPLAPFEQFDHSDVAAILDSDTVASASQESEESEEATDDEEKEKDKERKKQEEEKKKDRELLLAVWTLNPDGMDFLDRESRGETWAEVVRRSYGPGPLQDEHAWFTRPKNVDELTRAFDASLLGRFHLSADRSLPADSSHREPIPPFPDHELAQAKNAIEAAILKAATRAKEEAEAASAVQGTGDHSAEGTGDHASDSSRRSTSPDSSRRSTSPVPALVKQKPAKQTSARGKGRGKRGRAAGRGRGINAPRGRKRARKDNPDLVVPKKVAPRISEVKRVQRMGPGASAQPSLALLVVLDEDFGDKSRGMFAQQHDTEFVAKALRSLPRVVTDASSPCKLEVIPATTSDKSRSRPAPHEIRTDGLSHIRLWFLTTCKTYRIPIVLTITYRDVAGATELALTSSDLYLTALESDLRNGALGSGNLFRLRGCGVHQIGENGDEFVPADSLAAVWTALSLPEASASARLADLSEWAHLTPTGKYIRSRAFQQNGWAVGGTESPPVKEQSFPEVLPGMLDRWRNPEPDSDDDGMDADGTSKPLPVKRKQTLPQAPPLAPRRTVGSVVASLLDDHGALAKAATLLGLASTAIPSSSPSASVSPSAAAAGAPTSQAVEGASTVVAVSSSPAGTPSSSSASPKQITFTDSSAASVTSSPPPRHPPRDSLPLGFAPGSAAKRPSAKRPFDISGDDSLSPAAKRAARSTSKERGVPSADVSSAATGRLHLWSLNSAASPRTPGKRPVEVARPDRQDLTAASFGGEDATPRQNRLATQSERRSVDPDSASGDGRTLEEELSAFRDALVAELAAPTTTAANAADDAEAVQPATKRPRLRLPFDRDGHLDRQLVAGAVQRPDVPLKRVEDIEISDATDVLQQLSARTPASSPSPRLVTIRLATDPPMFAMINLEDALSLLPNQWLTTSAVQFCTLHLLQELQQSRGCYVDDDVWIDLADIHQLYRNSTSEAIAAAIPYTAQLFKKRCWVFLECEHSHWRASVVYEPARVLDESGSRARVFTVDSLHVPGNQPSHPLASFAANTVEFVDLLRQAVSPGTQPIEHLVDVTSPTQSPRQSNGSDCGLFAAAVARVFAQNPAEAAQDLVDHRGHQSDLWNSVDRMELRRDVLERARQAALDLILST